MSLIDMMAKVAAEIGGDEQPFSLAELHQTYATSYPAEAAGFTRANFDTTFYYHCINMRSRFPDPSNTHLPAEWLEHPYFKRVRPGQYMLLSPRDREHFLRCVQHHSPLVYEHEYDVAALIPPDEDVAQMVPQLDAALLGTAPRDASYSTRESMVPGTPPATDRQTWETAALVDGHPAGIERIRQRQRRLLAAGMGAFVVAGVVVIVALAFVMRGSIHP